MSAAFLFVLDRGEGGDKASPPWHQTLRIDQ